MVGEHRFQITLVYSPRPRVVREMAMEVAEGTTVQDVLLQSQWLQAYPELANEEALVGIWGRMVTQTQRVRAQDRIEIYRPLTVDPKVARRQRFTKQGAKAAGLFSKKREGAKAGY